MGNPPQKNTSRPTLRFHSGGSQIAKFYLPFHQAGESGQWISDRLRGLKRLSMKSASSNQCIPINSTTLPPSFSFTRQCQPRQPVDWFLGDLWPR
ncbi:hypothetical protein [Rubritalea tangerina]|uniref:hypothetical protein n=1 Tax=Rubritalea tangerina TaxID=430798 RepID=UPI0036222331